MPDTPAVLQGRCACGRVEFAAHAVGSMATMCYCELCRHASGGAGIAWVSADEASLRVNGEPASWRSPIGIRRFCAHCGGQLFAINHPWQGNFQVTAGSLVNDELIAGTQSVSVETRPPWDARHTLSYHGAANHDAGAHHAAAGAAQPRAAPDDRADMSDATDRARPVSGAEVTDGADAVAAVDAFEAQRRPAPSRVDARMDSLLASAPDAFVTIDPNGLVSDWSRRAQETFGWTYAEAIRQPLHELIIPPEQRSAHVRGLSRLQLTGHGPVLGRRFEVEALRKDGLRIPVELYVAPMRMGAGMGATAFLRDLRPQRAAQARAEAELHATTALLQRIGELASVGAWVVDLVEERVLWSPIARQIHGVDDAFEPTALSVSQFYSYEALKTLQAAFRQGVDTRQRWALELPIVTGDGQSRWVRSIGDTEFNESGQAIRVVGAVQDITEHKHLEARLAANEQFMRSITDNLPVRIGYLDRQGRYHFANRANCERLGAPRDQVLGHTRVELLGPEDNKAGAAHLEAALAGMPQKFEQTEIVDGRLVHTESQLLPDFNEAGAVQGIFTIGVDITERKAAEESLRVLAQIFDATPDYVVQADRDGRVTYMNPAVRRAVDISPKADVSKYSFLDFNTPETTTRYRAEIIPEVSAHGVWVGESSVVVASGVIPVNHMVLAHRDATGEVVRYSSVMRDISQVAKARAQVFRQRRTLSAVAEAIPTFIAVVDRQARYEFVNNAFQELLGRPKDDIVGHRLGEVLHAREVSMRLAAVEQALQGTGSSFELDMFLGGSQRNLVVTLKPRRSENGEPDGFIAVLDDVTVHKQRESRLVKLSEQDALTGLANRQGLESFLRSIPPARVHATAMLYVDLDRFKPVNDTHGHPVGDLLLAAVAARLLALVRPTDLVARLGGDEFVIVLTGVPGIGPAQATADKVVATTAQPFELQGKEIRIGASVGVALAADDGWEGLIQRADAAVYRAKAAGRGTRA